MEHNAAVKSGTSAQRDWDGNGAAPSAWDHAHVGKASSRRLGPGIRRSRRSVKVNQARYLPPFQADEASEEASFALYAGGASDASLVPSRGTSLGLKSRKDLRSACSRGKRHQDKVGSEAARNISKSVFRDLLRDQPLRIAESTLNLGLPAAAINLHESSRCIRGQDSGNAMRARAYMPWPGWC